MKSKRPHKRTRREEKRYKKKTILLVVAIIAIIGSFFYVMNHEYLAIEKVSIQGQRTLIASDISSEVTNYLEKGFLGIPNDNVLFISLSKIESRLEELFPKIEDIAVEIKNGDELVVIVGERAAHSLWCLDREYELEFDEECYFADRDGLLYARAPYFSGNVFMKLFIQPNPDIGDYVGTYIETVDSFPDFFEFLNTLEQEHAIALSNIYFDEFDDVTMKMSRLQNVTYNEPQPELLYNQADDYDRIIRNVGITLDFDTFKKDFRARSQFLESIDVRFDGRIFYVFTPIDSESE